VRRERAGHSGARSTADCRPILDEALGAADPIPVEAMVDPFGPPMPAKLTQSLIRGEPDREKIALTVLADWVREPV